MTLSDFINQNTGKANVGDTPQNIGQCVGLIEKWTDNLNLPHTWGNAVNLLNDADPNYFTIVYNKLGDTTQFPPDGAIVVFGKPYGLLPDGTYAGHTGISKESDGTTLRLFEQNDPGGSPPHLKSYTYDGVLGWLVPHATTTGTFVDSAAFTTLVQKSTDYDAFVKAGYLNAQNVIDKVTSMQKTIDDLRTEVGELTSDNQNLSVSIAQTKATNANLASEIQKIETSDSTAIESGIEASKEVYILKSEINSIAQLLHTKPTLQDMGKEITSLQNSHTEIVKKIIPLLDQFWKNIIKQRKLKRNSFNLKTVLMNILKWFINIYHNKTGGEK